MIINLVKAALMKEYKTKILFDKRKVFFVSKRIYFAVERNKDLNL